MSLTLTQRLGKNGARVGLLSIPLATVLLPLSAFDSTPDEDERAWIDSDTINVEIYEPKPSSPIIASQPMQGGIAPAPQPEKRHPGCYSETLAADTPASVFCLPSATSCEMAEALNGLHYLVGHPGHQHWETSAGDAHGCADPEQNEGGSVDLPALIAREFAVLPVQAPKAHLGPEAGWIPVNMDVVVAAEPATQEFTTTLVGTPVTIRAIPTTYHFDFGDGATITTHFPGKPWPAKHIVSRYQYEGWYELSLTTTFTGEYSINGGPYTPIDGYIEIESPRHWLYSDSLESRLVDGPIDPKKRDIPPRSLDTLGPQRDNPTHTTLKKPARP